MSIANINIYPSLSPDLKQELEKFRKDIQERTEKANQITRKPNPKFQEQQENAQQAKVQVYENLNSEIKNVNKNYSLRAGINSNIKFSEKNYNIISFLKSEEKRTNQQQYFNPDELDFDFTEKTDKMRGLIIDAKI